MASAVKEMLESTLDELEDLHTRGLFSREEIKEVVRRRTVLEYALHRRRPRLGDFMRSVEYEMKLERCRKLRLRRLRESAPAGSAQRKMLHGSGPSDTSIRVRVHQIYERALHRFKGDLTLWFRYLDHCKRDGATQRLGKAAARCLRLHSARPEVWCYVADMEAEVNGNIDGARVLLQRSIKLNPGCEDLWRELFRLELNFARLLGERRRALGIEGGKGAAVDGASNGSAEEDRVRGDVDDGGSDGGCDDGDGQPRGTGKLEQHSGGAAGGTAALEELLGGGVARIVFERAMKEVKDPSVEFIASFLSVIESFAPDFMELGANVCAVIKEVHAKDAQAWKAVAKYTFSVAGMEAALGVFRSGIGECRTEEMYCECVQAMELHADSLNSAGERAEAKRLLLEILKVCEAAVEKGVMGERLVQDYTKALLRLGRRREASEAVRAVTVAFPQSCKAWLLRLRLHARVQPEGQQHSERQHVAIIQSAIDSVPLTQSSPLWLHGIEFCESLDQSVSIGWLTTRLEWALSVGGKTSSSLQQVAIRTMDLVLARGGVKRARALMEKLLALPRPGLTFMRHCIDFEMDQLVAQHSPSHAAEAVGRTSTDRVRDLLELAVAVHGEDEPDLWLRRWRIEKDRGGNTGSVYWRAVKALRDPKPFTDGVRGF